MTTNKHDSDMDGMNDPADTIDEGYLKEHAASITEEEIERVTDRADDIRDKFSPHNPLGRLLEDAELLISIVRDYWSGSYRRIPRWALGAIVFALLYALDPFDLIPDLVPGVGYVDDVAVVSVCLLMVERELRRYARWKELQAY